MKKLVNPCFIIISVLFAPFFCKAQLQITTEINPTALAQKLVGNGVIISNATLTPNALISTGFFHNLGSTSINIDSGIVITNGRAQSLISLGDYGMDGDGSFIALDERASTDLLLPGDNDLAAGIGVSPDSIHDAVALEFDFVPLGDSVQFRYVFGSEEYTNATVCRFSDPFAFFISGPGITGMLNIALVPGTNLPVTPQNVNDIVFVGSCVNNPQYYIDNGANRYFIYEGHTKVFIAKSHVLPCQVYHFKLVVADFSDNIWDTGVMIEAGSLTSNTLHIDNKCPLDGNTPYVTEGCNTGAINIYRGRKEASPQNATLAFAGTAGNGSDVQLMPVSVTIPANDSVVTVPVLPIVDNLPEGIEKLKIYLLLDCASSTAYADSIIIDVRDYDTLSLLPKDSSGFCKGSSLQLQAAGSYTAYSWNNAATLTNAGIANPVATPVVNRTVYVCTANQGACNAKDSIVLKIKEIELVDKTNVNCFGASTGSIKVGGGWEWKRPVQFKINNGVYQADSLFINLPVGTYSIKIKDAAGCTDSMSVTLAYTNTPLLVGGIPGIANCTGTNAPITLSATQGQPPYLYSINGVNYSASNGFIVNAGNQLVYAKDANGCVDSKQIAITRVQPLSLTTSTIPAGCSGNADGSITVTVSGGNTPYSYSLDGINFQNSNVLASAIGNKTVFVKDAGGCPATKTDSVLLNNTITVNAGNTITICESTGDTIHAVSNASSFSWLPTSHLSNPFVLTPIASPVTNTTYTVTAKTGICSKTSSVMVMVRPAPVPHAGSDTTICFGNSTHLSGTGGTSFLWHPSTLLDDDTLQNPLVITPPTGITKYNLSVTDIYGCKSLVTAAVEITALPPAKLFVGNDTSVAIKQPVQLQAVDINSIGFIHYSWSPVDGLDNPFSKNPVAILSAPETIFGVTATTANGCIGLDSIKIKTFKGPEIYVPTAFNPGSVSNNNILKPILIGMKYLNYFKIFNRYGQLVFSTAFQNTGWNGTYKGEPQSTAAYVWVAEAVDYFGKTVFRKGSFLLIR